MNATLTAAKDALCEALQDDLVLRSPELYRTLRAAWNDLDLLDRVGLVNAQ